MANNIVEIALRVRRFVTEMAARLEATEARNRHLEWDLQVKNTEIRIANENIKELIERVQQLEKEKQEIVGKDQKQVKKPVVQNNKKETRTKEPSRAKKSLEKATQTQNADKSYGYGNRVDVADPPTAAPGASTGGTKRKRRRN